MGGDGPGQKAARDLIEQDYPTTNRVQLIFEILQR
jgi:hypothetical protein